MVNELFGSSPQVKVVDFLLAHPFGPYTKQQIAVGAGISRATLDKFIHNLIDLKFLNITKNNKYELNTKSYMVNLLDKVQHELATKEMIKQAEIFDEKIIHYSDEEIENMFEIDVPEIDLDEAEQEIIDNEEILVNKKEFDFLLNFYNKNIALDSFQTSKNMEKIISETTAELFEKISNLVFEGEEEISKKKV